MTVQAGQGGTISAGRLSVGAKLALTARTSFVGTGALAVTATKFIAAGYAGSGLLSAGASLALAARTSFAGGGALSVDVRGNVSASACYAGGGSLSSLVSIAHFTPPLADNAAGWAALPFAAAAWVGDLSIIPLVRFAGAGRLTVSVSSGLVARAAFAAHGRLCVNTAVRKSAPGRRANQQIVGPGPTENALA